MMDDESVPTRAHSPRSIERARHHIRKMREDMSKSHQMRVRDGFGLRVIPRPEDIRKVREPIPVGFERRELEETEPGVLGCCCGSDAKPRATAHAAAPRPAHSHAPHHSHSGVDVMRVYVTG